MHNIRKAILKVQWVEMELYWLLGELQKHYIDPLTPCHPLSMVMYVKPCLASLEAAVATRVHLY